MTDWVRGVMWAAALAAALGLMSDISGGSTSAPAAPAAPVPDDPFTPRDREQKTPYKFI